MIPWQSVYLKLIQPCEIIIFYLNKNIVRGTHMEITQVSLQNSLTNYVYI